MNTIQMIVYSFRSEYETIPIIDRIVKFMIVIKIFITERQTDIVIIDMIDINIIVYIDI